MAPASKIAGVDDLSGSDAFFVKLELAGINLREVALMKGQASAGSLPV